MEQLIIDIIELFSPDIASKVAGHLSVPKHTRFFRGAIFFLFTGAIAIISYFLWNFISDNGHTSWHQLLISPILIPVIFLFSNGLMLLALSAWYKHKFKKEVKNHDVP